MSTSNRLSKLEQRPQPQRPHGMTNQELDLDMQSMNPQALRAFVKTMTDDDLTAGIEYFKTIAEQHHAST